MPNGKLLVVDDEESVAVTMGAILEMDGYSVSVTMSGADALRQIREMPFDLVLTDLRLDDIDGLTILSEICRVHPDTVTIILTGYASLESAIKALREGAYDYLVKPCDVDELRIDAATAQLQVRMQELATALEQLQEIDRLKSRFLSMASHELKTPLTSISGLAQVLLRRMRRRPPGAAQLTDGAARPAGRRAAGRLADRVRQARVSLAAGGYGAAARRSR